MTDALNTMRLDGTWVGISGAVPDLEAQEICGESRIHETVRRLVERILAAGGNIVYGSHPTFTDVIDGVAEGLFPEPQPGRIRMYVGRRFFHAQPGEEEPEPVLTEDQYAVLHGRYAELVWVGPPVAPRQAVLDELRKRFISDADALVCIGGKGPRPDIPPGVAQEATIAADQGKPVFLMAWAGGHAHAMYQDAKRGQGLRFHNSLTDKENEQLADPNHASGSVDMVLEGLSRIRKA